METITVTQQDLTTFVEGAVTEDLTAYKLIRKANEVLSALGLKELPTQMGYNYTKQGLIKTFERNGQKLVSVEDARTWLVKYLTKKVQAS